MNTQQQIDQLKKNFDDFVNQEYADFSRELMLYTNRRTMQIMTRYFNKKMEVENKIGELNNINLAKKDNPPKTKELQIKIKKFRERIRNAEYVDDNIPKIATEAWLNEIFGEEK